MKHGELVERLAKFHIWEGEGSTLREVDPECADALNAFWEMIKTSLTDRDTPTISQSVWLFERAIHYKMAELLSHLSDDQRGSRLMLIPPTRREMVIQSAQVARMWRVTR